MNIELLEQVERTGSKNDKEILLRGADGDLRLFLEQCLDPDITYGITCEEDEFIFQEQAVVYKDKVFWSKLKEFLDQTAKRFLTGNSAQAMMRSLLAQAPSELHIKWACRLINKQLRAGFDISTYNKAFGAGTVEKFAVQLADTYEGEELRGRYFVQPKLDGNRVVFIDGKAMSRNGKEYPNCEHVAEEILGKDPDFFKKWVLDGEMMGDLGFDKSSGALRRINEKNREKATFTYYAFDIIDRKEWERRKTVELERRSVDLTDKIGTLCLNSVRVVPTVVVDDPTHQDLMDFCDEYVAAGFEGAMVKDATSPYVFKRGKNLLKVKKFYDADFGVVDFYEGKGQHKGSLGGIIVEGEYKGIKIKSKVGSGFAHVYDPKDPTAVLRQDIWNNRKDWKDAIVQIQFQEATKDGSLRFPVFIMRRKDKE